MGRENWKSSKDRQEETGGAPEAEQDTTMPETTNKRLGGNTEGTTVGIHENAIEEGIETNCREWHHQIDLQALKANRKPLNKEHANRNRTYYLRPPSMKRRSN